MRLIELTAENWRDAIALEVDEAQKKFIASNVMTIAQWKFTPELIVKSLGNDDGMFGLVAYFPSLDNLDASKPNSAYIMRFMIDKQHQGKGYGRKLLDLTIEAIRSQFPATEFVYLSVVPDNSDAKGFYENLGFGLTGKVVWNEDEYRLEITI